jgi:hypothetical protein
MAHYSLKQPSWSAARASAPKPPTCARFGARSGDRPVVIKKTGKVVTVYEDNRFGGYGPRSPRSSPRRPSTTRWPGHPRRRPDVPGVPYNHRLEDWFMVSPDKIADAIRKLAAY